MSDYRDAAFASAFRYSRVAVRGSATIADETITVSHDLGYVPFVRIAALYPNGKYGNTANAGQTPQGDASAEISIFTTATTTTLSIQAFDNTSAARSVTIYYKIYAEELS